MRQGLCRGVAVLSTTLLTACGSAPPQSQTPQGQPFDTAVRRPESDVSVVSAFEKEQRERALGLVRQKRWGEATLAWEVLSVLRPGAVEYRERLVEARRQVDVAVTERLPRAALSAQRGDIDGASQQYLAVLALQPDNKFAAEALKALERERNKRGYLGKYSRLTITRRAVADAESAPSETRASGRNDIEHAALLAGDGEFDDAIGLLQRRLAVDRRDAQARRLLANIYYRQGESMLASDPGAAVAAWRKSAQLDPSDPHAAARLKHLKALGAGLPAAGAAASAASSASKR